MIVSPPIKSRFHTRKSARRKIMFAADILNHFCKELGEGRPTYKKRLTPFARGNVSTNGRSSSGKSANEKGEVIAVMSNTRFGRQSVPIVIDEEKEQIERSAFAIGTNFARAFRKRRGTLYRRMERANRYCSV